MAQIAPETITLEQIMADPDWMGHSPERPYWADDGQSIYFLQKRDGEEHRDLIQIDLEGTILRTVEDADRGTVDYAGGDWSRDFRRKIYSRQGDLYIKNIDSGTIHQLTRSAAWEGNPFFMVGDEQIAFSRSGVIYIRDLTTGLENQPADLRAADDPEDKKKKEDYLSRQQERLFKIIRKREERSEKSRKLARQEQEADSTRPPLPWYLGKDQEILQSVLSPRGDFMIVRLAKKGKSSGKRDTMPNYITEDGYVSTRSVHSKVGTGTPRGEKLLILNLTTHEQHEIDLTVLPGLNEDPLKELREAAKARREAEKEKEEAAGEEESEAEENGATTQKDPETSPEAATQPAPATAPAEENENKESSDKEKKEPEAKPRPVSIGRISFTNDGKQVALQCSTFDNKDKWIARINLEDFSLIPITRLHDDAWLNWRAGAMGWLRDNHSLFYVSEKSGYAHLYLHDIQADINSDDRALTTGHYEVSAVSLNRSGSHLYYTANVDHPGIYERYRVEINSGTIEQLTHLGGQNRAILSPDEQRLLIVHSETTQPPELYLQANETGAVARRLTHTISDEFMAIPWVKPQIVKVPSRTGSPIYSRLYLPESTTNGSPRPAVLFIHGAGYLQNAHHGWSHYFREFMFHSLLVQHGYVVLDMDYRASAGYGRDWRTAIYRRMGEPEVEDLADGVSWLIQNHGVDPTRVGCYGGSYGGFLTLMALFRQPDLFACGAALRPVTDWAHYNHGYTANILNIPSLDPEAYENSSPIEFAEGLAKPLLICHGIQDDNVFFQDTVRLAQRLIELEKENWEVAMFPIEPHGFREPSSWLNEYRRILKLFETHLK